MREFCRIFHAGSNRLIDLGSTAVSICLVAALLPLTPQSAEAVNYTVCPAPGDCDFETPDAAVNNEGIANGDIIDITPETYVLGAAISVTGGANLILNGSTVENSSANDSGGGLSNINSTVDIFDSAFF